MTTASPMVFAQAKTKAETMIAILKQERIEELVSSASAEALDHPEAFATLLLSLVYLVHP